MLELQHSKYVASRGHPKRISTSWGWEGVTNHADKVDRQGKGAGLAVNGHLFSVVSVREKKTSTILCVIVGWVELAGGGRYFLDFHKVERW